MTLLATTLTLALAGMAYMSNGRAANHKSAITAGENSRTAEEDTSSAASGTQASARRVPVREHCPFAQKAVGYYRHAYTTHRQAMNLAGAVPRAWYPCPAAKRRAAMWRDRAHTAALEFATWRHYQFAWWDWMPRGSKWYRVASCETGYGRDPNFAHDSGTYVSAFGIFRPGYADDAHRIGALSWDETRRKLGRLPTPREQYKAALSHYRAHGGFSGWGCRGA